MKRAYLLAHPAGHSISPAMQGAAFAALGIHARYEALDVPPEALPDEVARLRVPACYGANVTVPHKLAVIPLLDALTPEAAAIGAVNTVVQRGGQLIGHNTDASGFLRALRENAGFEPAGALACVLGAGGAARAVVYALLKVGARVAVYNRSPEKARSLAQQFAASGSVTALEPDDLAKRVLACDLLVNATSVGMRRGERDPDESPLPPGVLPRRAFVCDIVYRPPFSRLLRDAQGAGLSTQNGLPMLVYQGAEALERWTGQDAPIAVMLAAAHSALQRANKDVRAER